MAVTAELAARSPVRVLAVATGAGRAVATDLLAEPRVRLVASPRHATVLLVAGQVPAALGRELGRLHDQLPHPRATVWWGGHRQLFPRGPEGEPVAVGGDVVAVVAGLQRSLLRGDRPSDPDVLPRVPPAFWKGVGMYGTGGVGMMGGRPFGRPMAMTGEDRDGLQLDALPASVGPFFPGWPVGLRLDLVLQGDLVQQAQVAANPFPDAAASATGPGAVVDVELARARHHLRWLAWALRTAGLPAFGARAAGLARGLGLDDGARVRRLVRAVRRSGVLHWGLRGLGVIPLETVGDGLGVVSRASGSTVDARRDDPAYGQLGFTPCRSERGDVAARWSVRLDEIVQSLELARAARATSPQPHTQGPVEPPGGSSSRLLELLPDLLADREWGELVATVVSLDLDLERVARRREGVAA